MPDLPGNDSLPSGLSVQAQGTYNSQAGYKYPLCRFAHFVLCFEAGKFAGVMELYGLAEVRIMGLRLENQWQTRPQIATDRPGTGKPPYSRPVRISQKSRALVPLLLDGTPPG